VRVSFDFSWLSFFSFLPSFLGLFPLCIDPNSHKNLTVVVLNFSSFKGRNPSLHSRAREMSRSIVVLALLSVVLSVWCHQNNAHYCGRRGSSCRAIQAPPTINTDHRTMYAALPPRGQRAPAAPAPLRCVGPPPHAVPRATPIDTFANHFKTTGSFTSAANSNSPTVERLSHSPPRAAPEGRAVPQHSSPWCTPRPPHTTPRDSVHVRLQHQPRAAHHALGHARAAAQLLGACTMCGTLPRLWDVMADESGTNVKPSVTWRQGLDA
jgi:hypothetical protein